MGNGPRKVLLIGYGNPGRLDDGLGPALAAEIEKLSLDGVTVDSDYQLTVEDAAAVAEHDAVVFVDAAVSGPEPFAFTVIEPKAAMSFSSHSVEPAAILALARDLLGKPTPGYCLAIRGYDYNEYCERLSEAARRNLQDALEFIVPVLRKGNFKEVAALYTSVSAETCITSIGDAQCKTENT